MSDTSVSSTERRYDVGFGIDGDAASTIVVDIFWPQDLQNRQVFFCTPGGGMNRHYFDLQAFDNDDRFSFARRMAAQGFVSVLVDPPGIGDSDRPEDGHALTGDRIADILAKLQAWVSEDIREGRISDDLPAMPDMLTIGIGHSMGAMLTVIHQHAYPQHAGIALLGFGTQGLPQFLPAEAQAHLNDLDTLRKNLLSMARRAFPQPYPVMHSDGGEAGLFGSTHADPEGVKALKAANDVMLPVPALMSMFPGNVAPECAEIEVPVYLALGERDLIRKPEEVPAAFSSSRDVKLQILPKTGHSHFLFPARDQLFDGVAGWAKTIA